MSDQRNARTPVLRSRDGGGGPHSGGHEGRPGAPRPFIEPTLVQMRWSIESPWWRLVYQALLVVFLFAPAAVVVTWDAWRVLGIVGVAGGLSLATSVVNWAERITVSNLEIVRERGPALPRFTFLMLPLRRRRRQVGEFDTVGATRRFPEDEDGRVLTDQAWFVVEAWRTEWPRFASLVGQKDTRESLGTFDTWAEALEYATEVAGLTGLRLNH